MEQNVPDKLMYMFLCPECGMSDTEIGHLSAANDLHCVVCLIDEDRYVRLRRWLAETDEPA